MYTVLVCDDEKYQREGLARHVNWAEHGFDTPILCASAWEALEVLREHTVDLLLTDVCMPGKDGLKLIEECRAIQPELYVVMISSFVEFDYARRAMQSGAREYLLKPIKPSDVHQVLTTFLHWKNAGEPGAVTVDKNAARVMQLLEEHLVEGITIAELADAVHINASYLCTLFKKTYGVTIAEQMNILQRERACRLLATSDLSMGEIAYQTGSRTASNFAQWFRKSAGMTPGEYRRLVRETPGIRNVNNRKFCKNRLVKMNRVYGGEKKMKFIDQILLKDGWLFSKGACEGAETVEYDDSTFAPVTLPHDWQITEKRDPDMDMGWSQGYYPREEMAWYRLRFDAPADWQNKVVQLKLDGCQRFYDIYLNGVYVGGHRFGYVPTVTPLDAQLRYGQSNVLAIRVNNEKTKGDRWYSGAGLCRMASLLVDEKAHIAPWSVFAQYELNGRAVNGKVDVRCVNAAGADCTGTLALTLKDAGDNPIWHADVALQLKAGDNAVTVPMEIAEVQLWDVEAPNLYYLDIALNSEYGTDHVTETIGFRSFSFDGDSGFTLNGRNMKMYGADLHHDGGVCFGAAVPRAVIRRRLTELKKMGCNAIRCSHNPHDEAMYDLCDEVGLLMIDEVYDKWCRSELYFGILFEEDWRDDLKAMVLRDRNHPSIVLWSLGNEIEVQFTDYFYEQLKVMIAYCKELDPTRPVTEVLVGFCGGEYSDATPLEKKVNAALRYSEIVDVFCGNYMENYYSAFRDAGMDKAIIGTEVFSYYRHEELTATGVTVASPWRDVDERPYVCGGFVWAGVDYLGESTGYPCKGWTGCPIDSTGTWKLRAWHLASQWSEKPVLKLGVMDGEQVEWDGASSMWGFPNVTGHWNYPQQERIIHVVAMTNCDEVRLYQNNDFVRVGHAGAPDRMIHMYVRYRQGTVRAEGWKDGRKVIETTLKTSTKPEKLQLTCDPAMDDGLLQVDCWLLDEHDQPWVNTNPEIHVEIKGPAALVGLDHGDFMREVDPRANHCSVKDGHAIAYVQRTGAGQVTIRATGPAGMAAELVCE